MFDFTSFLYGFLSGTLTGAAGGYFASKFTDERREKETKAKSAKTFETVRSAMPELIAEMKIDLSKPENATTREFFVIPRHARLNVHNRVFVYFEEDHADIQGKLSILLNRGYIHDITPGNAPKFRMSEEFVELILM